MLDDDLDLKLRKWKIAAIALTVIVLGLGTLLTIMYLNGSGGESGAEPSPGLSISEEDLAKLSDTNKAFVAVSEYVGPSVVQIRTLTRVQTADFFDFGPFGDDFFEDFFGPDAFGGGEQWSEAGGSGVIVSEDGYILTNNHVVEGAREITVALTDGREYDAEVVGVDPGTDLSVIRIDPDGDQLPVAELGDSDEIRVGDWVVALGSPFGLENTVTAGIISAKGRSALNILDYEDFIQTDAAINPGNSGGALVNLRGEVVGINTAIYSTSGGYMGIGLAIPINLARTVMDQLIETGEVTRGWLGVYIQDVNQDLARALELPDDTRGALIGEVMPDTPAEDAGLRAGDVVVAMNGEAINGSAELRNKVARLKPGEVVEFDIVRDGDTKTIAVTIGERPVEEGLVPSRGKTPGAGMKSEALGVEVGDLTLDIAAELGYEGSGGVVVTGVDSGSDAYRAGLRSGMIIVEVDRTPVDDPAEFTALVEESEDPVLLYVWSQGVMTYLAIEKD